MSAYKKSRSLLLGLSLAFACLLGVFAIIHASSANANPNGFPSISIIQSPNIIVHPAELEAALYPDEQINQTLWITNTSNSPITFTVYEMTSTVPVSEYILDPASTPLVDPVIETQVASQGEAMAIIYLREKPDLAMAYHIPNRTARAEYVYQRLLAMATHSQALGDWLESQGAEPHRLLITNAIAATLNSKLITALASNPLVKQITANRMNQIIPVTLDNVVEKPFPPVLSLSPQTVEWNIAKIGADEAWSTFNVRGQGAVVGIIDTGVMYDHPALVSSYRGNQGDGTFNHNYSWFDFMAGNPLPYDDNGHGTMLTGVVSGDDGAGNQIGVAPGAEWIGVKACSGGGACNDYELHSALGWMIAPTDLNGANPDPAKAPNIVLGGWGGSGCSTEFEMDLMVLRAMGILPVFPPGGGGPGCGTVGSPADLPEALAAGSTDQNDLIASNSPRGTLCHNEIKPDISAPGVSIRSSFLNGSYATWSGSSLASAHAAGAAALVLSANPALSIDEVESILYTSALCIENLTCGGTACPGGANNVYGHGRIDAYQAVASAFVPPPSAEVPWLSEIPISATLPAGGSVAIQVTFDSSGLEAGSFRGALGILSSGESQTFISVPVTLIVGTPPTPVLSLDPTSFSATLEVGEIQTDTLSIGNEGGAVLTFTLYEISSTRQLILPPGDIMRQDIQVDPAEPAVDKAVRTEIGLLGESRVIIYLKGQPDFAAAATIRNRAERVQYVYDQLAKTGADGDSLYEWLQSAGCQPRKLLTANAIAATLDEKQLLTVLTFKQVARVGANQQAEILQDGSENVSRWIPFINFPRTVEWNIAKIRADETWNTFGIGGQGAVVGVIDTGVMYTHPALVNQYRGNQGGGVFDHNYSWFDFVSGGPAPYDDSGHGTFGMGIAVGDDGGVHQIGVAPDAQWIAVKACSMQFGCTLEDLHAALAWMVAPTDLAGGNPNPSLAPEVVLNMWGMPSYNCDHSFDPDIMALRAANILPVFAPGGEGPGCGTVALPAANPETLAAGATDTTDYIAPFSARGPSACYGGGIKPDVVAPGVNILSSTIDGSYVVESGTSFSTALLAGAAAMLFSADPEISLDTLTQTLFATAVCLDDPMYCGGEACPGANNTYGHGRIDVYEAVSTILGNPYDIPWLTAGPLDGIIEPGGITTTQVIFNAAGMAPGTYYGGIGVESNDPASPFTVLPVTLTVTAACEPISDLMVSYVPLNPRVGESITFTATASGTLPITYTWSFDDGTTAVGGVISHTFDTPGSHVVNVSGENACDQDVLELNVVVEAALIRTMLPVILK